MAIAMISPKFYGFNDTDGKPLAFGKVYTYQAGTNTSKPTYTSESATTQNANPVILNAAGYADIYLSGSYKVVVKDANDVEVWTADPVSDLGAGLTPWIEETAAYQVAPNQFKVTGNKTDIFRYGTAVKLDDTVIFYGVILGSSYAGGETTVTIDSVDNLTADLNRVWASLVGTESILPVLKGEGEQTLIDAVTASLATFEPRMQQRFSNFLANSGYQFIGNYQLGIEVTEYNQVIRDVNGEFWRADGTTKLPYTTTGAGMPEGGAFQPVGDAKLRGDLAAAGGVSLVGNSAAVFNSVAEMAGATWLTIGKKVRTLGYYAAGDGGGNDYDITTGFDPEDGGSIIDLSGSGLQARGLFVGGVNFEQFGVKLDGITDDTVAINDAISYVASTGGGTLRLGVGTAMASQVILKEGVYIEGAGYDVTRIKQIAGTNSDFIKSDGYGVTDINRFGLTKLDVDGNYFTSDWNAATGTIGNTSGNGLAIQGYSFVIDIGLTNVAGVGAYFKKTNAGEASALSDYISRLSITGKDFGKEGLIIEGPNDWILERAWIGRAGILPRPAAETTIALSDVYSGEPVDGIVIDGANIEIGDVHVFACWSGTGFRTRNTCRLTKGGRVISESSRSQVNISSGTYGSAMFDIRNLSLLHPNWTGTIPTYSYPDSVWDGSTINAGKGFSCEITCKRTTTAFKRVVGSTACHVVGEANVDFTYSNSTAPAGDPEAGVRYTGTAISLSSTKNSGIVNADVSDANGRGVEIFSSGVTINASTNGCSTAIYRDTLSNAERGNNISGSVYNCGTGFQSVGTPTSEVVNLSMELTGAQVPFVGDAPDLNKGAIWSISASVANSPKSTKRKLTAAMSDSSTSEQTLTIPHGFLYTPRFHEVQFSVDDRSTVATNLDYVFLNDITSTDLVFKYKYSSASNPAANQRLNVSVG